MATLQKIRNRAGLLILIIGLALLAFIIGDGLRSGSTLVQGDRQTVLKLNNKKVGYGTYQQRLQEMTESYEAQGNKLSEEDRMELNNRLAEEFIQTTAIEEIAEKVGLRVTAKEYLALLTGEGVQQSYAAKQFFQQMGINPTSKEDIRQFINQLDDNNIKQLPEEYQSYYIGIKKTWQSLSSRILNERLLQKFTALMSRSYVLNKIDQEYLSNPTSRTVALVRTPSTLLEDENATATDSEVETYYKQHPNLFKLQSPYKKVDYISLQIRPSQSDLAQANKNMLEAKVKLANTSDEEAVVRNYDNGFAPTFYLTSEELSALNLSEPLLSFVKGANVGEVNSPVLANDTYQLIKLVDRKQAPTSLTAQVVVLDTLQMKSIDSLVNAINSGATTFANVVATYSKDEQTKAEGGYITFRNPTTGVADRNLSRRVLASSGLEELFDKKPLQAFVHGAGANRIIMQVASYGEVGDLYKIAYAEIPSTFSDETYNQAYAQMNELFSGEDTDFDKIVEQAEKKGLQVSNGEIVNASSAMLGNIPSSREVVSWALRGKQGDINEKIFRCGSDHLVIARIGESVKGSLMPLSEVKEEIRNRLTAEKRGDLLAQQLASKGITSLAGYATAMKSVIDTVSNVSNVASGAMPPEFNGMTFNTEVGTLSKPFRAQTEVMVLQPLTETKSTLPGSARKAQLEQQRNGTGQAMGYRGFQYVISQMKIKDNRGNFF